MAIPFGHSMRAQFQFAPNYTPLNHGSFGTYPKPVRDTLHHYQDFAEARPDPFIRYDCLSSLDESRAPIARLLNVSIDEVVFVPNATTGINTVLRSIKWEEGDVIVYFELIYGAIENTVAYLVESTKLQSVKVEAQWPIGDDELLYRFEKTVKAVCAEDGGNKKVRMAIFDTICSMPGVRMPFERLVAKCKELNVLSMLDGAHGIGHIPLDLTATPSDFFVSNLHKWLFIPRGVCALHVPIRNQPLIRSTLPTSHGFIPLPSPIHLTIPPPFSPFPASSHSHFVEMFTFTGTIDTSPYFTIPAALSFRHSICGGEKAIMQYCMTIAHSGGARAAEVLGTEVMDNAEGTLTRCAFANVRLPLEVGNAQGVAHNGLEGQVSQWLMKRCAEEYDMFLAIIFYRGSWWWRISGQIYLELMDIERGARGILVLCQRVRSGDYLGGSPGAERSSQLVGNDIDKGGEQLVK